MLNVPPIKIALCLSVVAMPCWSFAQTQSLTSPEVILPSQQKKLEDSRYAAGLPMPAGVTRLGVLATDLVAYFPMDDKAKGCMGWSRRPISVTASKEVEIKQEGARKFADFSAKGARLIFDPPLDLSTRFTLAAWVQAPAPQKHGVIWHGPGGILAVLENSLTYWPASVKKEGNYARTTAPLSGWIHVAVAYDGGKTQAFLNGAPLDSFGGSVSSTLQTVGNHPDPMHHHWMMAAGIDEQYFFLRNLTAAEVRKVCLASEIKEP